MTRFTFGADFALAKEAPPVRIAPDQHEAAVAAAELRGYQRGLAAGEARLRGDAQARTAAAFERIADAIAKLFHALKAIEQRLETHAVAVAIAAARKLAPALIAREPLAEIAALAGDCFRACVAAPHIAIRVNTELYAQARDRLDAIACDCGCESRLVVLGEPDIACGDCRIEWADGGVIRDQAALAETIEGLVSRYIAAHQAL
jgi:flagellar assembly protein FliH